MIAIRRVVIPIQWQPIKIAFAPGIASSASLSSFLSNPEDLTVTYAALGPLVSGVTLEPLTGLLSYSGIGSGSVNVAFRATVEIEFPADSQPGTVEIPEPIDPEIPEPIDPEIPEPIGNQLPQWIATTPANLGDFTSAGGTFNLGPFATDAEGDPIRFYRTGSAVDSAPGSVSVDEMSGVVTIPPNLMSGGYGLEVDIRQVLPDTPPVGADLVAVTVQATGITSWTIGHAFREGDALNLTASGVDAIQVDVLNRWSDESIKFAVISGRSAPGVVMLQSSDTTPNGAAISAITSADVGATSVTIDGEIVTLASALSGDLRNFDGAPGVVPSNAGLIRDWIAGPVMRESHYYAPVVSKSGLAVIWHVRKYASGQVEIETIVENGWFGIVAAPQTYSASVTVNGTARAWHDGPTTRPITHDVYRRWSRVDWVGTDSVCTVLHDTAYLAATKLVPNYGWPVATSEAAFTATHYNGRTIAGVSAAEVTAPRPFDPGFWRTAQAAGGEISTDQIGLLPSWEAVYLRTGDIRAHHAVLLNSRLWQFIPTWRRDERTLRLPRTDATTIISYGTGNAEREHQPSTGYLGYLLTGRTSFLEACQNTALWNFFRSPTALPWPLQGPTKYTNGRGGLRGILVGQEFAPRAVAWPWRSLATACTITPDADPAREDFEYCVQQNVEYFWGMQRDGTPMANNLGIVWMMAGNNYYSASFMNTGVPIESDPVGPVTNWSSLDPWQHGFLSSAIGFTRGLGLVSGQSAADLASLHAHSVKAPVGRMGNAHDGTGYSWRRSSTYREPVGYCSRSTGLLFNPPASFLPSWRACYEASRDYWGATDQDDSQPSSTAIFDVWSIGGAFKAGFEPGTPTTIENTNDINNIASIVPTRAMIHSLAFGVDYAVPGAREAYDKFMGANVYGNNATAQQNLANFPRYMVTPR